jgi:large subunit ribosomal protein L17
MRHRVGGKKLNRDKDHRASLLKNLASSLILHGKIETSVTKAKFLRPFVEKLITKAKDSSYNSLRTLRSRLSDEAVIRKLVTEVAPKMKERNGGYTRISKLGIIRKGDNSEMAKIELVQESLSNNVAEKEETK